MSLAEIRVKFENFFSNHKQISSFYYGSLEDFIAIPDKDYVTVNVDFVSSNYDEKYINHQYRITMADLYNLDYPETENSAINNMSLLMQDFLAYLREIGFIFSSGNIQPFSEETGDITAGAVMLLNIKTRLTLNECAIPGYEDIMAGAINNDYGTSSPYNIVNKVTLADTAEKLLTYTPTSSTDSTYPNTTVCSDDNYLYRRNNTGTWTKIAWGIF